MERGNIVPTTDLFLFFGLQISGSFLALSAFTAVYTFVLFIVGRCTVCLVVVELSAVVTIAFLLILTFPARLLYPDQCFAYNLRHTYGKCTLIFTLFIAGF